MKHFVALSFFRSSFCGKLWQHTVSAKFVSIEANFANFWKIHRHLTLKKQLFGKHMYHSEFCQISKIRVDDFVDIIRYRTCSNYYMNMHLLRSVTIQSSRKQVAFFPTWSTNFRPNPAESKVQLPPPLLREVRPPSIHTSVNRVE